MENSFPLIKNAPEIAFDLETKDPSLKVKGPGAIRKEGYVLGVAIATDTENFYLPLRHEEGDNVSLENATRYLKDSLGTNAPKVGANLIYDLEWIRADLGVHVGGPKYDIQIAEWLLDEEKDSYSLNALCLQYLGKTKSEDKLKIAAERMGIKESKIKENLWQMHVNDVAEYARADAKDSLDIWQMQKPLLITEEVDQVFYSIETPLMDVLVDMRFKGVPVDLNRAFQVRDELLAKEAKAQAQLNKYIGAQVDVWSGNSIADAAGALGLPFPSTAKGNPSFESKWLESQTHEFFKLISTVRKLNRGGSVFVEKKIIEMTYNGHVYPMFRQSKTDDGGTKSGRFASSNPNMQQVPARDEELAPLIRSIFIPEPGCQWAKFDYKQQEPRMTVHYAYMSKLPGAKEAKDLYDTAPDTDYHQMVADMAKITRSVAKTMNLGLAYGMGKTKMADGLGVSLQEAGLIYDQYHKNVPFVKALTNKASNLAELRGYIKTISGRRKRFNLWGPKKYTKGCMPLKKADAQMEFEPPIVRWFCYRAMNSLIQGSCADMTKLAMIDMHKAGYTPSLTVHDEVDDTTITNMTQVKEINDIMINCMTHNNMPLTVPLLVDVSVGKSWGEAKKVKV
jgi:DNA polymerase I-like protein with 3'-5' exonuclease and polymerase domains